MQAAAATTMNPARGTMRKTGARRLLVLAGPLGSVLAACVEGVRLRSDACA